MPWVPRGLARGIVTTRYPRRPDGYGEGFHGTIVVSSHRPTGAMEGSPAAAVARAAQACPTGAITLERGAPRLDRGRCILCARCTQLAPASFRFDPSLETASVLRRGLVVPPVEEDDALIDAARADLAHRVRALRRSVHVRHVDAGSDGSEEWEVAALTNPVYDVHRLGVFFTASPKHADLLLVTGAGASGMVAPLRHTYELMPEPKIVVAAGVDTASGGMVGEGYATRGGVAPVVPVDVFVPGSPPSPFGILFGILLAVGILGRPGKAPAQGPAPGAGP
jgi:Ni,Fe-hydrogenase III small subunit/ferredoxin